MVGSLVISKLEKTDYPTLWIRKIPQKWGIFYLTSYILSDILLLEVVMRNQYEKKCCWCKVVVPLQEGRCWNYNGRWYVGCQDCLEERKKAKEE